MAGDYRDTKRLDLLGHLHGEVMVFQRMEIRQISEGGILIETSFALHVDSLHDFRLTLGDRSVVVKGRVVHSHITDVDQDVVTYQSGVEFVELSEPVHLAISAFIEAVRQARHNG